MILMGKDFGYTMPGELPKIALMNEYLTEFSEEVLGLKIDAKFSLPSKYFEAVKEYNTLRTKNLDFINYDERIVYLHPNEDENIFDYWVGYYSTRPHLKKMINQAFNNFRTLETLITYLKLQNKFQEEWKEKFLTIETDLSYLLHHDAITGTSREGTIHDYYVRVDEAETLINELMQEINLVLTGNSLTKDEEEADITEEIVHYFNQASYTREIIVRLTHRHDNVRVKDLETEQYLECELLQVTRPLNHIYCLMTIDGLTLKNLKVESSKDDDLDHQAKILEEESLPSSPKYETAEYSISLNEHGLVQTLTSKSSGKS